MRQEVRALARRSLDGLERRPRDRRRHVAHRVERALGRVRDRLADVAEVEPRLDRRRLREHERRDAVRQKRRARDREHDVQGPERREAWRLDAGIHLDPVEARQLRHPRPRDVERVAGLDVLPVDAVRRKLRVDRAHLRVVPLVARRLPRDLRGVGRLASQVDERVAARPARVAPRARCVVADGERAGERHRRRQRPR